MSTYTEWTLPLNPPNPYPYYLHSLAPMAKQTLYYTKYILGVVGELDTKTDRVREWTCPPFSARTPTTNLTRIAADTASVWCVAQDYNGALIHFDPAHDTFTRWATRRVSTALVNPIDLDVGDKDIWYIAGGTTSTIARFDKATGHVVSWGIPVGSMLNLSSIAVDRVKKRVWVSSIDPNYGSQRAWIGCLDLTDGVLICYYPNPYGTNSPRSARVVVDGDHVWFTAAKASGANTTVPAIYRMDRAGNALQFLVNTDSWPRHIAIEGGKAAWVTDIGNSAFVRCDPGNSCDKVVFAKAVFKVKQVEFDLAPTKRAV
ncbi:MAG TPA: hypothetical protein VLL76_02775, partial [Candidatus Omnitrophota bacterium]|nr:hypothetical protein [Candidatus Omnitrophota bacterium]